MQEETRRAEQAARTMSERTIDAQRASAPVPRYGEEGGGEAKNGDRSQQIKKTHTLPSPPHTHSDTVQLYQQLADAGLQYGPAFRLLRNVHVPEME